MLTENSDQLRTLQADRLTGNVQHSRQALQANLIPYFISVFKQLLKKCIGSFFSNLRFPLFKKNIYILFQMQFSLKPVLKL